MHIELMFCVLNQAWLIWKGLPCGGQGSGYPWHRTPLCGGVVPWRGTGYSRRSNIQPSCIHPVRWRLFLVKKRRKAQLMLHLQSLLPAPSFWKHLTLSVLTHIIFSSFLSAIYPTLPLSVPQGSDFVHFALSFSVLFPLWPEIMWESLPVTPPHHHGCAALAVTCSSRAYEIPPPGCLMSAPDTGCLTVHLIISFPVCFRALSTASPSLPPAKARNLGIILNLPFTLASHIHISHQVCRFHSYTFPICLPFLLQCSPQIQVSFISWIVAVPEAGCPLASPGELWDCSAAPVLQGCWLSRFGLGLESALLTSRWLLCGQPSNSQILENCCSSWVPCLPPSECLPQPPLIC